MPTLTAYPNNWIIDFGASLTTYPNNWIIDFGASLTAYPSNMSVLLEDKELICTTLWGRVETSMDWWCDELELEKEMKDIPTCSRPWMIHGGREKADESLKATTKDQIKTQRYKEARAKGKIIAQNKALP